MQNTSTILLFMMMSKSVSVSVSIGWPYGHPILTQNISIITLKVA